MPGRGAIAGRLVVFPNVRRAGKSTLSAAPARAGHRVFSDDVVPFSVPAAAPARGLAMEIAPRLLLPMTRPSAHAAMDALLSQRPACVARQIGETL